MFGWDDAAMIGLSLLGPMLGGGGKQLDAGAINSKYMGMRPEGWLTTEDMQQSERFRSRGTASMAAAYGDERARAIGRAAATRKSSASVDRNQARLADMQAAKVADVGLGAEEQLYRTKMGREAEMNDRIKTAWGAELGAAGRNFSAGQERDASMWNSILELAPGVIDSFKAGSVKPTAARPSISARPDSGGVWGQTTSIRSRRTPGPM